MSNPNYDLREDYLQALVNLLRQLFEAIGVELPRVRVSCSWAYGGGRNVVGQCFPPAMVADGIPQIKISPILEDPFVVAHVMVHELIHAYRPDAGHGRGFKDVAVAVGLKSPMRSTKPGPELGLRLLEIVEELGPYPHTAINLDAGELADEPRAADGRSRQKARLVKVTCPTHGYIARVTRVWLNSMGAPICPCGARMQIDSSHPRGGGRR
jgi:hypothetical protein